MYVTNLLRAHYRAPTLAGTKTLRVFPDTLNLCNVNHFKNFALLDENQNSDKVEVSLKVSALRANQIWKMHVLDWLQKNWLIKRAKNYSDEFIHSMFQTTWNKHKIYSTIEQKKVSCKNMYYIFLWTPLKVPHWNLLRSKKNQKKQARLWNLCFWKIQM